jgi:hypothetical protein
VAGAARVQVRRLSIDKKAEIVKRVTKTKVEKFPDLAGASAAIASTPGVVVCSCGRMLFLLVCARLPWRRVPRVCAYVSVCVLCLTSPGTRGVEQPRARTVIARSAPAPAPRPRLRYVARRRPCR